jgi:cob(I)alamin adenosyltransferase
MAFKIYTKTGDKGETSLIGGTRLPKQHIRIESYGTVDELNSQLGLIRDVTPETEFNFEILLHIQDRLFTIGSHLAADPEKNKMVLPALFEEDVIALEKAIDKMNDVLPEMKHFVLPGGHIHVSYAHIARTVCRRAERAVLKLSENEKVEAIIPQYLNRLSDYIFVLSRYMSQKLNAKEIPWLPKK